MTTEQQIVEAMQREGVGLRAAAVIARAVGPVKRRMLLDAVKKDGRLKRGRIAAATQGWRSLETP